MKVVAYIFYIGNVYYVFRCYNINDACHSQGEVCPHGLVDSSDLT